MAKKGNVDIDLKVIALDKVKRRLESAIDDAVKTKDLQAMASRIQSVILLRTQRGFYLDGSGGKEKRTYRSQSHIQKRQERGLPVNRVTLFFGDLGLLEAMRARGRQRGGQPTIEVGYFDGLSEQKATEIAGYMNDQGVGINRVTYPYVGLTDKEREQSIEFLRGRLGGNLQQQFG